VNNRTGRFEAAHTGSIFLDEINSTSLFLQVKLLRVLQEREFERVGDTTTIRVDVRVIAASNRDLYAEVDAERFREDLYWRLNVVPIVIPPLRMRREDIPALVAHFLNYYSDKNDKNVVHIQAEAIEALQDYHWPGNVRELQNYVERAVAMADGDELTVELLPDAVLGRAERRAGRIRGVDLETLVFEVVQQGLQTAPAEETELHEKIVNRVERELIVQVMQSCNNVQTKAATRLGINRNTLRSKLQQYNLEADGEEQKAG
jgi:DNA-binding NtrC family response regulator